MADCHDHFGVAIAHAVIDHHRRLNAALDEEAEEAERDVQDDLDVDPGMVGHPEAVRHDLLHVPPGPQPVIGVRGFEEALCDL